MTKNTNVYADATLEPHRGVAVGEPDRQRLGQRRVQHPGEVEFAERQRHHHQRASEDSGPRIRHDHVEKAPQGRCAERGRAFVQRLHVNRGKDRHHRAHHERQREHDVASQNEQPGPAEIREAVVGQQQGQCDREAGNRKRQRDDFLDCARHPSAAHVQRVGRRDADEQRDDQGRTGDKERAANRVGVEVPDLHDPLQGEAVS